MTTPASPGRTSTWQACARCCPPAGGHFHLNLGDENFRKVALNTLVREAKGKVPATAVSVNVTESELRKNLDPKPRR